MREQNRTFKCRGATILASGGGGHSQERRGERPTRTCRMRYSPGSQRYRYGPKRRRRVTFGRSMKMTRSAAGWLLLCTAQATAFGRGVSPYLPLNLEPEIERQIERVLILADKPVMTRPIAAAIVLDALPKACKNDAVLCEQVGRYLARYTRSTGVTH